MSALSDNDKKLFREAMQDVTPINATNCHRHKHSTDEETSQDLDHSPPIYLEQDNSQPDVFAQTPLFYAQPGVNPNTLRRLKRGQFEREYTLDLHGLTLAQAEIALANCLEKNNRTILVIHGKGRAGQTPILKNALNRWLRCLPKILAFSSALPADGGTGSVYVLLKKT
jgi:DNA-nicking Smr family endonuclease